MYFSIISCYIIHGKIFIQDNDSKHRSKSTREWMEEVGMINNVMETPDINPLESLWSAKKKSKKTDNLVMGIRRFWEYIVVEIMITSIERFHMLH